MTLKEQIHYDFVVAVKDRDEVTKMSLECLKSKILEAEKTTRGRILTNDEVVKIIVSQIKQRNQSYEEFINAGREDLANKELNEIKIMENYLPTQLCDEELEDIISEIMIRIGQLTTNKNALIGKTIGEFNKSYPGMADPRMVSKITQEIANRML